MVRCVYPGPGRSPLGSMNTRTFGFFDVLRHPGQRSLLQSLDLFVRFRTPFSDSEVQMFVDYQAPERTEERLCGEVMLRYPAQSRELVLNRTTTSVWDE